METNIFEANYEDYCRQIAELDISSLKDTLGIQVRGQEAIIPFLGVDYIVSGEGITDKFGSRPNYMICVILSKYLLRCPDAPVVNREWAALKDFHRVSQFTNLNVFASDAEKPIVKRFSGRLDALSDTGQKLGGEPFDMGSSYDLSMEFSALPQIGLLLLFNDCDDEFPATCSVLFHRQAEFYLDPESLIMTGMAFAQRLNKLSA